MGNGIFYHGIIFAVQQLIKHVVEGSRALTDGIEGVIQELIDHQHRAVRDAGGPVLYMLHKSADHFLRANDFLHIVKRFAEKFPQPCFTAGGPGKIQLVKNRILFFGVEDGDVAERCVVYLHGSE